MRYPLVYLILACLHSGSTSRRTVTLKITFRKQSGEEKDSSILRCTEINQFSQYIGESPTEGVLGRSHSCREMREIKIITTQTTPANATVAVERGKCDSVTACSPLSGPGQRLMQPAIYANIDESAIILDKRLQEIKCPEWSY